MAEKGEPRTSRSSGKTRAVRNREVRQKAFREQMAAYGVFAQIQKINKKLLDPKVELDSVMVARLSKALDSHHKMLDKFVSQAPTETVNDHTVSFPAKIPIELVKAK